jgi:Bacterial Ig-like domain (group 3)/IPT/TIG domain
MKLGHLAVRVALLTAATTLLFTLGVVSASAAVLSGTVSGQAPGEEAKPLPETIVTVMAAGSEKVVGTATADGKGAYSLEISDGIFDVRFNPPSGYEPTTVHEVEVKGSRTLSVVLANATAVHLTGTLRDASGEPVPGANIILNNGKAFASGQTAVDGSFDLAAPAGNYTLSANGTSKSNPSLPSNWYFSASSVSLEEDRSIELNLPPTVQLTIEALDAKGGPLPEVAVSLPLLSRSADLGGVFASYLQSRGPGGNGGPGGKTGPDGRATFTVFGGQAVNSNEVGRLTPPQASGYGELTFKVPFVEGDTTLTFNPPLSVHLTGTLRDASGEPVPGANIILNNGKAFASGQTAVDGSFDLAAPAGNYTLSANGTSKSNPSLPSNWYFSASSVSLEEDRSIELNLPPTVQLTIEALDAKGGPLPEVAVSLPLLSRSADLGGVFASYLQSRGPGGNGGPGGKTGPDGRATFTVFGGQAVNSNEVGRLTPPQASGYGELTFKVPFVEGDTTLTFKFGSGQEEPEEPEDITGPQLKELGIEPASIDTSSSAQEVLVRTHIADDLSGFAGGTLVFTSPSGEAMVESSSFERWNGSATAGDYEIHVLFPRSSEEGDWELAEIRLFDAAGNETAIGLEQLEAMEFQHAVHVEAPPPPSPVVTSVSPNFGAESGGTEVQIAGSGFGAGAEVFFGSTPAPKVVVNSGESITAMAPAGSGTLGLTVKTSVGVSEIGPLTRYRYSPPVTLKSNPNPSQQGNKVTFTARVLPLAVGAPIPTGAVVFKEGPTTLAVVGLSEGKATLSTSDLPVGVHAVTAEYSGDAYFGPQSSGPVIQEVVPKKGNGRSGR